VTDIIAHAKNAAWALGVSRHSSGTLRGSVWFKLAGVGVQLGREGFGGDWQSWNTSAWAMFARGAGPDDESSKRTPGWEPGTAISVIVMHLDNADSLSLHSSGRIDSPITPSNDRSPLLRAGLLSVGEGLLVPTSSTLSTLSKTLQDFRSPDPATPRMKSFCCLLSCHHVDSMAVIKGPFERLRESGAVNH